MKHHVMLTVVAVVCASLHSRRARRRPRVHRPVPSSSMRRASLGRRPAIPPRGAQFRAARSNPAEPSRSPCASVPPNYRYRALARLLEHVTVLSGTLNVGMGEQPTYSAARRFRRQLRRDAAEDGPLRLAGSDGVVFQLHSVGPWSITYVSPKDDPRQAAAVTDVALLHSEDRPHSRMIKGEVLRLYQEVAEHPEREFILPRAPGQPELFGYEPEWLDRAPPGAVGVVRRCGQPAPAQPPPSRGSGWTGQAAPDSTASSPDGSGPTGQVIGVD